MPPSKSANQAVCQWAMRPMTSPAIAPITLPQSAPMIAQRSSSELSLSPKRFVTAGSSQPPLGRMIPFADELFDEHEIAGSIPPGSTGRSRGRASARRQLCAGVRYPAVRSTGDSTATSRSHAPDTMKKNDTIIPAPTAYRPHECPKNRIAAPACSMTRQTA